MARVLVSLKVFPSDITVDLGLLKSRIREALPEFASVHGFAEEPIAFGLTALIAHILVPEERPGGLEEVEGALRGVDGVDEIQPLMVRRV